MTRHQAAPRSPAQARVSQAPHTTPCALPGPSASAPSRAVTHHRHRAEPGLSRGTPRAVLLDGRDNLRHLPEARMHRLERHWLAMVCEETPRSP
jgi:hypothetical protein